MSKRTMKCPDCGAPIPNGAAMCSRCGYKPQTEGAEPAPRKMYENYPRPVETSRWPDQESYEEAAMERKSATSGKNTWQLAIVGALILVILVIAVVLIIKMTAPAEKNEVSDPMSPAISETVNTNGVHVISGEDVNATDAPAATDAPQQEGEAEEENQPEETPEPTPEVTPEPTPEPDFAPDPSITISEMKDTVYVTANGVNLRIGPGTEYDVIKSLSRGDELDRVGVTNNGWSEIDWDGERAFLSNDYVSEDKPEAVVTEKNDTVYVTGNSVNLREGAGTEYDVTASLTKGTELKRTGTTDNGWTRVEYDGKTGYISSNYVSADKPAASVSEKDGTVIVTTAANLRTEPNESGDVIAIANPDVELKRTGVTDTGWTRVEYDGKTAYVHSSLLKDKDTSGVTEESGTLTVTTRSNIRSGPSTGDSIIATVDEGTTLTKTGRTDGWFRVTYNDQTGYISESLVAQG